MWLAYVLLAAGTVHVGVGLVLALRDAPFFVSPGLYVTLGTIKLVIGSLMLRRAKRRRRMLALQRGLDVAFREEVASSEPAKAHEP